MITLAQLCGAGLTPRMVRRRVERGWLRRAHQGVYVAGPGPLSDRGRLRAALLACGEGAVASHGSAAWVWGLTAELGVPEITVPRHRRPRHAGVVVHRPQVQRPGGPVTRSGFAVTTVRRTLMDLASRDDIEQLAAEAHGRRLVDLRTLTGDGVPARLRAVAGAGPQLTRSEAERVLLGLIRRAGLPRPETNVRVGAWTVDVLWRDAGLAVELDSWAWHGTRTRFERDRAKDRALRTAGFTPLRLTAAQVATQPEATIADLAATLARLSAPRSSSASVRSGGPDRR